MNVLLIGSGGREHALAYALSKSKTLDKLFCNPGNPGIFKLSEKANIDINNFNSVIDFSKSNDISLVVVGPEQPLANGISDVLNENGIAVFGPSQYSAQLESSKGFAKDFMKKHGIPTADYKRFDINQKHLAHEFIDSSKIPLVIKADGLAAGKGVIIAESNEEAHSSLDSIFDGMFKDAGNQVVIEEFMDGEEASILAICDGNDFVTLASSQDHKRIFDGDKGKNTGGMGAYSPAKIVTDDLMKKVCDEIIIPVLNGMKDEGHPFIGCLYAGLMIKNNQANVVEFNVRFGDPETQVVLSLFDGDFAKLLYSASTGKIDKSAYVENLTMHACCVVLASSGYPDSYKKGFPIHGIENVSIEDLLVFHAGTSVANGELITDGGRVLGVTGIGDSLKSAIDKAYSAVDKINFENKYFRKDIGKKGL